MRPSILWLILPHVVVSPAKQLVMSDIFNIHQDTCKHETLQSRYGKQDGVPYSPHVPTSQDMPTLQSYGDQLGRIVDNCLSVLKGLKESEITMEKFQEKTWQNIALNANNAFGVSPKDLKYSTEVRGGTKIGIAHWNDKATDRLGKVLDSVTELQAWSVFQAEDFLSKALSSGGTTG